MAASIAPLLHYSKQIIFVDPHFTCESRFLNALRAFLTQSVRYVTPGRLEYHTQASRSSSWFRNQITSNAIPELGILGDVPIYFIRWARLERAESDKMHPRYVLTERGGISFDFGLDEGKRREFSFRFHTHNQVFLILDVRLMFSSASYSSRMVLWRSSVSFVKKDFKITCCKY